MPNMIVELLSAIFYLEQNLTNCPVCGAKKTSNIMVCPDCFAVVGDAVVFNRAIADITASSAHKNALKGGVKRGYLVDGNVFANRKIGQGAKLFTPRPETGILPYLQFSLSMRGGNMDVNVFGATEADRGKTIAGIVEVKYRETPAGEVPYIRIQKVEGVVSDVNLVVADFDDNKNFRTDLPSLQHRTVLNKGKGEKERLLKFALGFVNTPAPETV